MASAAKVLQAMAVAPEIETDVGSDVSARDESLASLSDDEDRQNLAEVEALGNGRICYQLRSRALPVREVAPTLLKSTYPRREVCWADLRDSDEETTASSPRSLSALEDAKHTAERMVRERCSSTRWADLMDSDDEGNSTEMANTSESIKASSIDSVLYLHRAHEGRQNEVDKCASLSNQLQIGKSASKGSGKSSNPLAATIAGDSKVAKIFGKGYGKGAKGKGKGAKEKFQCQFTIGIEEDSQFRVVQRIIGVKGANMKHINEDTGVKLRLRGRGSKFAEPPLWKESTDPLMLCVSSQEAAGFKRAKELVCEILLGIYKSYDEACAREGQNAPNLAIQLHEGPRAGSR